jgi:hypothetical protein
VKINLNINNGKQDCEIKPNLIGLKDFWVFLEVGLLLP